VRGRDLLVMDQKTATGRGRGEAYYRGLLIEQESSGQSLRSFARERGLSAWTLYGWRQRLGRTRARRPRASVSRMPGLVAVDVVGEAMPPQREIEVVLADGVRVRVPYSTSLERLVAMVQALRSC
jgi:transposase-like protein